MILVVFSGVSAVVFVHVVTKGGATVARTTNLLKLKVIACMKAENWFLTIPLYLTLLFCFEKTCSNGALNFV